MPWHADSPFNDLPRLPPLQEIQTRLVLKATIEARAALASLDQAALRISNPTVLINTIPLFEAHASSEIENIVTTADDLFALAHIEAAVSNPAIEETLSYRRALFTGIDLIRSRPLSVSTAPEVCSIIKGREMQVRRQPGTFIGHSANAAESSDPIASAGRNFRISLIDVAPSSAAMDSVGDCCRRPELNRTRRQRHWQLLRPWPPTPG